MSTPTGIPSGPQSVRPPAAEMDDGTRWNLELDDGTIVHQVARGDAWETTDEEFGSVSADKASIANTSPGQWHYMVGRNAADDYDVVDRTLSVVGNFSEAGAAFQYAYDNAPDVATIGVYGAGKGNPYEFETTWNVENDAISLIGAPRHAVVFEPDPDNPPADDRLIYFNTASGAACNALWGIKFGGNSGSVDAVVSDKHTKNLRFVNCHTGPNIGGYAVKNNHTGGVLLCGQGTFRAETGDIYSEGTVYVDSLIDEANVDGGAGSKVGVQVISGDRIDAYSPLTIHEEIQAPSGENYDLNDVRDIHFEEGRAPSMEFDADNTWRLQDDSGKVYLQPKPASNRVILSDFATVEPLSSAPPFPSAGSVACQDGTNWDPAGTGNEEIVGYVNGSWVALS